MGVTTYKGSHPRMINPTSPSWPATPGARWCGTLHEPHCVHRLGAERGVDELSRPRSQCQCFAGKRKAVCIRVEQASDPKRDFPEGLYRVLSLNTTQHRIRPELDEKKKKKCTGLERDLKTMVQYMRTPSTLSLYSSFDTCIRWWADWSGLFDRSFGSHLVRLKPSSKSSIFV